MTDQFRFGIEEEYFLADTSTARSPDEAAAARFHAAVEAAMDSTSRELLIGQIEAQTEPLTDLDAAQARLRDLRRRLAELAAESGLDLLAAGTHPLAVEQDQRITDKTRYRRLAGKVGTMAERVMVCAMHVHVEVPDPDQRVAVSNRLVPFLPLLLALSVSSPFWEGHDTGLKAFRPIIIGDLPRSGLPEIFESWSDWEEMLQVLAETGMVTDPSKIWWDLRPSVKHPTLEMRICDICTRAEDGLTIAALYQALLAFLADLKARNQRWRHYRDILILENKWRAQRYGVEAKMADFGRRALLPATIVPPASRTAASSRARRCSR